MARECDCGAVDKKGNVVKHYRPTHKLCKKNPRVTVQSGARVDDGGDTARPANSNTDAHTVSFEASPKSIIRLLTQLIRARNDSRSRPAGLPCFVEMTSTLSGSKRLSWTPLNAIML